MDISDILADATSHIPSRSQKESDHIALTRAWVNERNAPEILPWPTELIDRVMDILRSQVIITIQRHCLYKELTASADRKGRRQFQRYRSGKQFQEHHSPDRAGKIQISG